MALVQFSGDREGASECHRIVTLDRHVYRLILKHYLYVLSSDNDGHLFLVVRDGSGGRHRACVAFRPRSPEVVQLYHVIATDTCHADVFDDVDAWLLVDVAALQQPFPVLQRQPCALRGGFQMHVSGIGTATGGSVSFRKCGSFVEMRIESDCSGEFGMYFNFRLDVCVPEGLFMYARQRTLCVGNWTSGPYTFVLLRHDVLPYFWIFRFQTALEESFVAYLLSDLVDDIGDIPSVTSRYFRFDMVRSTAVPVTSLCADESEICASIDDTVSRICQTGTGNETFSAAPALTCPRACGLCNATRPARCEFPPEMVESWHNGVNFSDAEFQLTTASDRKSIDIAMVTRDAATVKQRFYCIQWETAPTSGERPTHGSRFVFDEFLLVDEPIGGCKRRYACAWVLFKSASVMYFWFSESRTWPFTLSASDPIDCSWFDSDARFQVLVSRDRRDLVTCHLPTNQLTNYSVAFNDVSCDAAVAVEPEIRHRLRLTLADCTSTIPSTLTFDCLDSMLATPTGDVILVTTVVAPSTSGSTTPSPARRTSSSADHVTKVGNVSLSGSGVRLTSSTTSQFQSESLPTSSPSSSTFYQPDAVHCWLFARSSYPHEFQIFSGSQCDHVVVTSETGRQPWATFVRKRVRWPRLFSADQPVSPTPPEPEIVYTSGRTRDSRRLSALDRDTEHEKAKFNHSRNSGCSEENYAAGILG